MDIKYCPKCKEDLLIERFNLRANGNFYSWCKTCTSNATKETDYYKPKDAQRRRRARPFRSICHSCKSRNIGNKFDLTEQYLIDLYEKQEGKCYWLGVPMSDQLGTKAFDLVTVDRLDNNKGYTRDNIVLACWYSNLGRGNKTAEEYRIWVELLRKQLVQDAQKEVETQAKTTLSVTMTAPHTASPVRSLSLQMEYNA